MTARRGFPEEGERATSGIPWSALQSYARERSHLKADPGYPKQVPTVFFLNRNAADRILALSGRTFADAFAAAGDSAFTPVGLGASVSIRMTQRVREFGSDNVVARITGSDPAMRNQAVIYSAHWDHMGIDPNLKGDQIYNGAVDNALGVAGLLELARAFKTPAEEQRLGLDYFGTRYHQVTDSVRSDWDLTGAEEDFRLLFELGWRLADGAPRPVWKTGPRHTLMFGKRLAPMP